ncbi:hypothetical protein C8R47DRAFT_1222668 [Mycena vitilis]|nr:hypothetical protein C8R47DRAFT_1222668 [Mycena vitilis]
MGRHPKLYFSDGTLTLKAGDGSGTLYNVYRAPLMLRSEFFGGMFVLPGSSQVLSLNDNAKECLALAKSKALDGTSDANAVDLPAQFAESEIEKFLEFIFLQGWSLNAPDLDTSCAILKISFFFGVDTGINFARHHLDNNPALGAFLRLRMGFDYHVPEWIAAAFDELMSVPLHEVSPEDEVLIGWLAYRALARAQARVLDYRLTLAVKAPTANHCNWCSNHLYCAAEWEKMWTSTTGVLGALVKDELAGAEILARLGTYPYGGMNSECHRRTCAGLEDTADKKSILRVEEDLVDDAVAELIKQKAITT